MKISEFLNHFKNNDKAIKKFKWLIEAGQLEEKAEPPYMEFKIKDETAIEKFMNKLLTISNPDLSYEAFLQYFSSDEEAQKWFYVSTIDTIVFLVTLFSKGIMTYSDVGLEIEKYFAKFLKGEKNIATRAKADILVGTEAISLKFYRDTTKELSLGNVAELKGIFKDYLNKIKNKIEKKEEIGEEIGEEIWEEFKESIISGNLNSRLLEYFKKLLHKTKLLQQFYEDVFNIIKNNYYGEEDWIVAFHNGIDKINIQNLKREVSLDDYRKFNVTFVVFGYEVFYNFIFDKEQKFFSNRINFVRWALKTSQKTLIDFVSEYPKKDRARVIEIFLGDIIKKGKKTGIGEIITEMAEGLRALQEFSGEMWDAIDSATNHLNNILEGLTSPSDKSLQEICNKFLTDETSDFIKKILLSSMAIFKPLIISKEKSEIKKEKLDVLINQILNQIELLIKKSLKEYCSHINIKEEIELYEFKLFGSNLSFRNLLNKMREFKNFIANKFNLLREKINYYLKNQTKLNSDIYINIANSVFNVTYKSLYELNLILKEINEKLNKNKSGGDEMKLKEENYLNNEDYLLMEKRKYTKKNLAYWTWKIKQRKKRKKESEPATTIKIKDRVISGFLGSLARPTPPVLKKVYNQISKYYDEQQKAKKMKSKK